MNQKPGKGNFRELKSKKIPLEVCSLGPPFRKSVSIYPRSAPASIISTVTDHKNEIWKTVKLTSSYYLYSPSQSSALDSLSTPTIKSYLGITFTRFLSHILLNCVRTGEAIDCWRPMCHLIYMTTLRCHVVSSESKNIPIPRSLNLQKLANLKPMQSL